MKETSKGNYIEMKVKIGWFLFCSIMIFEGGVVPRKVDYKYLFIIVGWIMKKMIIILYFMGFRKMTLKSFIKITGIDTILIESDVYKNVDIKPDLK